MRLFKKKFNFIVTFITQIESCKKKQRMKKFFLVSICLFGLIACGTRESEIQSAYEKGHEAGYDKGYNEGFEQGKKDGYQEGVEDGKSRVLEDESTFTY